MSPWKKLHQSTVYSGWRNMIRKTFLLPNQEKANFDIVQNGDFVTIAAFTKNKEVLLVRQYRPGPEMELISFPEGYIDAHETPEMAAQRELLEETGYQAEQIIFQKTFRRAYNTEKRFSFLAINCEKVAVPKLDATEFTELLVIPLSRFKKMLNDSQNESLMNVDSAYMALNYLDWL